jgi:hypothetical protein
MEDKDWPKKSKASIFVSAMKSSRKQNWAKGDGALRSKQLEISKYNVYWYISDEIEDNKIEDKGCKYFSKANLENI